MKEVAQAYPETALFDMTFETNVNGYNIFGMYGQTAIGKGFPIFLALNFNGKGDTLRDMLESIKNPAYDFVVRFDDVVVGVLDKDFTEESILKEYFPNAIFLLCQFHVIKHVSAEVSKEIYGLNISLRKKVRGIIHLMVYSQNDEEYDQALSALKKSLSDDESHPFWQYWMINWHSIKFRWVTYLRDKYQHFGNTTNNRIESAWNRLKTQTSPHCGIATCIQGVFEYLEDLESLFCGQYYSLVNGSRVRKSHSMMFKYLIDRLSHWSWQLVEEQYEVLSKVQYEICEKDPLNPTVYAINKCISISKNIVHTIAKVNMKCSCSFMTVYSLPCRHVIFYAMTNNNPDLVHIAVHQRWIIHPMNPPFDKLTLRAHHSQLISNDLEPKVVYQRLKKGEIVPSNDLALDDKEKWNHVMNNLCSEFASTLSKMGHFEFQNYTDLFQQLNNLAKQGQKGTMIKISVMNEIPQLEDQEKNDNENKSLILSNTKDNEHPGNDINDSGASDSLKTMDKIETDISKNNTAIPIQDNELDIINKTENCCISFKTNFSKVGRPRISSKASKQKQKQYRIYIKEHIVNTGGQISIKHLHKLICNEESSFEEYFSKFKIKECKNKRPSAAFLTPSNTIISDCEYLLGQKIVLLGMKKISILKELPNCSQGTRTVPILRIVGVGMFHASILKEMAEIWEHRNQKLSLNMTHKNDNLTVLTCIPPKIKVECKLEAVIPSSATHNHEYLATIEWINETSFKNLGTVLPGYNVDEIKAKENILSELKSAPPSSCFIPRTTVDTIDIYRSLVNKRWLCNWIIIPLSKILVSHASVSIQESFYYMGELKNYLKPRTLYNSLTSYSNIFIPFNFNNNHWTGIWIDKENKTIEFYESTNLDYYKSLFHSTVLPVLKLELQDARIEWKSKLATVPVQLDGYNCGVLCLLYLIHKLKPTMNIEKQVPALTAEMGQTLRLYFLYLLVKARQRGSLCE
jgi:hypothetical protein